jgi:hypothetical protein
MPELGVPCAGDVGCGAGLPGTGFVAGGAGGCRGRGENHDGRRRLCRVRHPQIADPVAHVGDGWAGVVDHHEQQREENHHQEDVPDSAENVERGHRLVLFLSCVARTDRLGRLPLRLEC